MKYLMLLIRMRENPRLDYLADEALHRKLPTGARLTWNSPKKGLADKFSIAESKKQPNECYHCFIHKMLKKP